MQKKRTRDLNVKRWEEQKEKGVGNVREDLIINSRLLAKMLA